MCHQYENLIINVKAQCRRHLKAASMKMAKWRRNAAAQRHENNENGFIGVMAMAASKAKISIGVMANVSGNGVAAGWYL
jgi:hypothetical protein